MLLRKNRKIALIKVGNWQNFFLAPLVPGGF
jgi:hypothetical protein